MASKARRDFTVADIIRLKPKWFLQKQSNFEHMLDTLNYIHTLLSYGLGAISSHSFFDVFETYDIACSPSEYGERINRQISDFLAAHSQRALKPSENAVIFTPLSLIATDHKELIEALKPSTNLYADALEVANRDIASYISNVDSYNDSIRSYLRSIDDSHREIRRLREQVKTYELLLESDSIHVDKDKMRLLRSIPSNWLVVDISNDRFTIMRKDNLVLNYIGTPDSGMANTLQMGFLVMTFTWTLGCYESYFLADYIGTRGSQHPHLSGTSICWGNQSHKAERYKEERDYKAFFELFETLITTYCPDNPYESFSYFYTRRSSSYCARHAEFDKIEWVKRHKRAIEAIIRASASARYLQEYAPEDSTLWGLRYVTAPQRAQRVADYLQNIGRKVRTSSALHDAFSEFYSSRPNLAGSTPLPVHGEEMLSFLRSQGIYMPSREVIARTGVNRITIQYSDNFNTAWRLLLICYPRLITNSGNGVQAEYSDYSRRYPECVHGIRSLSANGLRHHLYREGGINDMHCGFGAWECEQLSLEAARAELPSVFGTPTGAPTPAAEPVVDDIEDFPELEEIHEHTDEEECEHEWSGGTCVTCDADHECTRDDYRSDGHCDVCGYYDSDYNTEGDYDD